MVDIIKIEPDKERAKNLLQLTRLRIKKIELYDKETDASLLIEAYYEIIKELLTALFFVEGYKIIGHKELLSLFMQMHNNDFEEYEFARIDDLRVKRNMLVYEGVFTNKQYLKRNNEEILVIINKLHTFVSLFFVIPKHF